MAGRIADYRDSSLDPLGSTSRCSSGVRMPGQSILAGQQFDPSPLESRLDRPAGISRLSIGRISAHVE